jgi:hypothetical protein
MRLLPSVEVDMREFSLGNLLRSVPDLAATLREPLDMPVWEGAKSTNATSQQASRSFREHCRSSLPSPVQNVEQAAFPPLPPPSHVAAKASSQPQPPATKGRYYSHALSDLDKHALAKGEENHNLKDWTPTDLLQYQDSRIELVPYCENRIEVLTAIAQDKRCSEQFLLQVKTTRQFLLQLFNGENFQVTADKKVRQSEGLPLIKLNPDQIGNIATYNDAQATQRASLGSDATQSMIDLRLPSSFVPMPPLPSSTLGKRPVSSNAGGGGLNRRSRVRPSSNGDSFAGRHGRHSSSQSGNSTLSTNSSNRVRSPLVHEYKAEVTFDSFLAPHRSGKGETFRDFVNTEVALQESRLRRISKMPSIPIMRKRMSKIPSCSLLDE